MLTKSKTSKFVVIGLLCLGLTTTELSLANKNTRSLDRGLLASLKKKNLKEAEQYLKRGANPEAILGPDLSDNAVCTAIDDRTSDALKLLVKYGASTNSYSGLYATRYGTPLACSVFLANFEAFDYLLENGADPSIDLYDPTNENRQRARTAFTIALSTRNFKMALKLVNEYELHPAELNTLRIDLENFPFHEDHPWNPARNELIKWTLEKIPTLTPEPAGVSDGSPRECLFSFRDHEEGLKKGTICWETDEIK